MVERGKLKGIQLFLSFNKDYFKEFVEEKFKPKLLEMI